MLHNFDFVADPEPAFDFDADLDPAFHYRYAADPDPKIPVKQLREDLDPEIMQIHEDPRSMRIRIPK
jgi:hypothetical protein